jgi:hypothetical protein
MTTPEQRESLFEIEAQLANKQDREAARDVNEANRDRDAEPFGRIPRQRRR